MWKCILQLIGLYPAPIHFYIAHCAISKYNYIFSYLNRVAFSFDSFPTGLSFVGWSKGLIPTSENLYKAIVHFILTGSCGFFSFYPTLCVYHYLVCFFCTISIFRLYVRRHFKQRVSVLNWWYYHDDKNRTCLLRSISEWQRMKAGQNTRNAIYIGFCIIIRRRSWIHVFMCLFHFHRFFFVVVLIQYPYNFSMSALLNDKSILWLCDELWHNVIQ